MDMTFNLMETMIVMAQFPGNPEKDYAYFVPEGDKPEVGDVILTSTSWDTWANAHIPMDYQHTALQARLARVIEVIPTGGHPKATRFYMKLVSVRDLEATHKRNQELAKGATERAEAMKRLDAMLAQRSRLSIYRELAKDNPEAAELLSKIDPTFKAAPSIAPWDRETTSVEPAKVTKRKPPFIRPSQQRAKRKLRQ